MSLIQVFSVSVRLMAFITLVNAAQVPTGWAQSRDHRPTERDSRAGDEDYIYKRGVRDANRYLEVLRAEARKAIRGSVDLRVREVEAFPDYPRSLEDKLRELSALLKSGKNVDLDRIASELTALRFLTTYLKYQNSEFAKIPERDRETLEDARLSALAAMKEKIGDLNAPPRLVKGGRLNESTRTNGFGLIVNRTSNVATDGYGRRIKTGIYNPLTGGPFSPSVRKSEQFKALISFLSTWQSPTEDEKNVLGEVDEERATLILKAIELMTLQDTSKDKSGSEAVAAFKEAVDNMRKERLNGTAPGGPTPATPETPSPTNIPNPSPTAAPAP